MALGYDGKLYILAFDHRGSFQKKMFGIEGDPTEEETKTISDAKKLIFEGMEKAVERGRRCGVGGRAGRRAVRLGHPRARAPRHGPVADDAGREVRRQNEFDFQYGDEFGDHIAKYDLLASKVLVRYNPDGDQEMNERQTERLKRLADWLHANDRKFLFELLVPAEDSQLESVGGDTDRYDAELRPELMRRVDRALPERRASRSTSGRSRASTRRRTRRCSPSRPARARAARTSRACCSAAARPTTRSTTGCARPRGVEGFIGFAIGRSIWWDALKGFLDESLSARPPPSRSPTTTCASSRSTTRPRFSSCLAR